MRDLPGSPSYLFNGGSRRSSRNDTLQTPPGLEGSNGSSGFVCRGSAGAGRRLFKLTASLTVPDAQLTSKVSRIIPRFVLFLVPL